MSCPYILRGRHPAVIPPLAVYGRYPPSLASREYINEQSDAHSESSQCEKISSSSHDEVLPLPPPPPTSSDDTDAIDHISDDIELPDLEGSSMKLIHKLLDLKRQKCLRDHSDSTDSDWVLCAYQQDNN